MSNPIERDRWYAEHRESFEIAKPEWWALFRRTLVGFSGRRSIFFWTVTGRSVEGGRLHLRAVLRAPNGEEHEIGKGVIRGEDDQSQGGFVVTPAVVPGDSLIEVQVKGEGFVDGSTLLVLHGVP